MMTHAELAAHMLREAAEFFRSVANDNPSLAEAMIESSGVYKKIADLVESDPMGELGVEDDPSNI